MSSLTLGLSMLAAAAFGTATSTPAQIAQADMAPAQTVQEYVASYFADIPVMIDIAGCESKFRQFDGKGNVLVGDITDDIGVMQINSFFHRKEAEKMGLDLDTIEGNIAFARYLYNKEGTAPWDSSSRCWLKARQSPSQGTLAVNSNK